MKIVVIGDRIVSEDLLADAVTRLNFDEELEIKALHWNTDDRLDFQKRALNLEKNGPTAEEPPQEVWDEIEDADYLLVHFAPVSEKLIKAGKKLKMIGTCRGGMEHIDVQAATEQNIPVIHVIRNAEATSDFTIGLMFAETRNIARAHCAMKQGEWRKDYVNNNYTTTFNEMTLGILGLGHIGKLVAKKAIGLGMKVTAYDPFITQEAVIESGLDVELVSRETLYGESDIVSIHLRATPETEKSVNKEWLSLMKPTAYLINTSRAQVVDREDLLEALENKTIGGAALDVFWQEPIPKDDPFLKLDNITLTSHNAGNVVDALPKSPYLLVSVINEYLEKGTSEMIVNRKDID